MTDTASDAGYGAQDIEILEGLEPVRRRPGMYVGGVDERAFHHLAAEIIDNAVDEAAAGHADRIEIALGEDGFLSVADNGRGVPVEPHPKRPDVSTVEVIATTLHAGGKFGGEAYATSGGLHGVGLSVVNALSESLVIEVARDRALWKQNYARGAPLGPLAKIGAAPNRRGTTVRFRPDPQIFGAGLRFRPETLFRMARSKAYLTRGVEIRWRCAPDLLDAGGETPETASLRFPGGLSDYLAAALGARETLTPAPFTGLAEAEGGRVEWAVGWPADGDGFAHYYCNTIPTPQGGTHEQGLRTALTRGLRAYGELTNNRRAKDIQAEDLFGGAVALLSLFMREPQFQGQTKDKLASADGARIVEQAVRHRFEHWLTADPKAADALLAAAIEAADMRKRRKDDKDLARKSATRRLRLPGKLADCARSRADGTEIFIVEGDSAGGSAKQARDRETQAVLPLRGKILNVASASSDKLRANQELSDLTLALGCGVGERFALDALRYERVVIMTDADVDGAHIAALLMTFFFREMRMLVDSGHLYLAQPPLYRLTQGAKTLYAGDDAEREALVSKAFDTRKPVEIGRFKGLGEMTPRQLRETTMDRQTRTLIRVTTAAAGDLDAGAADARATAGLIEDLMGRKPERRFAFIQDNARFIQEVDL